MTKVNIPEVELWIENKLNEIMPQEQADDDILKNFIVAQLEEAY